MATSIPSSVSFTGAGGKNSDYCMRQEHRGGEKLFIDYSDGLSIVDAAPVINAYPVICRRLGRFQLYVCRSHDVANITGVD